MKATALVCKSRALLTLLASSACGLEGVDKGLFEDPPAHDAGGRTHSSSGGTVTHLGGSLGLVRPHGGAWSAGREAHTPAVSFPDPQGAGGAGEGGGSVDPPQREKPGAGGSLGRGGASSGASGGKTVKHGGAGGSEHNAGASAGGIESGGAGGVDDGPVATLLFTEYLEGTSYNKALEITALTGGSLNGCAIEVYFPSNTLEVQLAGALDTGDSYVVCDSQFKLERAACDRIQSLQFNGDDAIALTCRGTLQDSIGERLNESQPIWGENITLRRRCEIQTGDPILDDPFAPALEWIAAEKDAIDDLGKHCAAVVPPDLTVPPDLETNRD